MHNIRPRRFSSVRFWHLLLFLAIVGWASVSRVQANDAACLKTVTDSMNQVDLTRQINFQPVFSAPLTQVLVVPKVTIAAEKVSEPCTVELEEISNKTVEATTPLPTIKPAAKPASMPSADPIPLPSPSIKATAVPTVKPTPAPISAPADLEPLFHQHAATFGVDPVIMKKIAQCESGMRPEAVNGPYGGMFQFVTSTWVSNRKAMGKDPNPALRYNAAEAIETAAFKMGRDGYGAWPACSRKALASI